MKRVAVALLVLSAVLVSSAGPVAAHGRLLSMRPADGSIVNRPPISVALTYSEVVQNTGAEVVVRAPSGARVEEGVPRVLDETVTQPLGTLTEPGKYRVHARVVSADGHPVSDEASFTVRNGAVTPAARPDSPPGGSAQPTGGAPAAAGLVTAVAVLLGIALVRRRRAGDQAP